MIDEKRAPADDLLEVVQQAVAARPLIRRRFSYGVVSVW
jgi:hypothetical protein